MPTNNVIVSDDGREMIVTTPHGTIVTLRSEHESGFTAEQIERAREYDFPKLISGENRRSWKFRVAGKSVIVAVNTGPPTWWLPRIKVSRNEAMVGWIRGLVAVSVKNAVKGQ